MTFTRNVMVDIIGEDCNSEIGVSEVAYSQNETTNTLILAETQITYKANLMNEGFVKLPRQILEDPRYRSARLKYKYVLWKIFELVCYRQRDFSVGIHKFTLMPGQYCISLRQLVDLCNEEVKYPEDKVDKNIVERSIAYFEKCNFVRQEVRHKKNILSVLSLMNCEEEKNTSETSFETQVRHDRDTKEEREERKEVNNCNSLRSLQYAGSSAQKRIRPPAVEQKGIFFSPELQGFQGVTDEDRNAWKIAFPLVDLQKETAAAAQWVLSNPGRKKTLWRRFLTNWFSKAQSYAENKAYSGAARALPVDRRQRDAAGNPIKVRSEF